MLRLWCVQRSVDVLPPGNRAVISRVCAMFQAVTRFAEDNKMTAKNIAIVMSPSMFRDRANNVLEFVSTGGLRVRLLELLIVQYEDLFVVSVAPLSRRHAQISLIGPPACSSTRRTNLRNRSRTHKTS